MFDFPLVLTISHEQFVNVVSHIYKLFMRVTICGCHTKLLDELQSREQAGSWKNLIAGRFRSEAAAGVQVLLCLLSVDHKKAFNSGKLNALLWAHIQE